MPSTSLDRNTVMPKNMKVVSREHGEGVVASFANAYAKRITVNFGGEIKTVAKSTLKLSF